MIWRIALYGTLLGLFFWVSALHEEVDSRFVRMRGLNYGEKPPDYAYGDLIGNTWHTPLPEPTETIYVYPGINDNEIWLDPDGRTMMSLSTALSEERIQPGTMVRFLPGLYDETMDISGIEGKITMLVCDSKYDCHIGHNAYFDGDWLIISGFTLGNRSNCVVHGTPAEMGVDRLRDMLLENQCDTVEFIEGWRRPYD